MTSIRLIAGEEAYRQISEQGLCSEMFSQIFAASGGPKWLGIAGLDKYLFGEFFKARQKPLHSLGTSSGAWRLACLAQQSPLLAYERLETLYINQRYDDKPTPQEISQRVKPLIRGILGATGAQEIATNPIIRSHFIVCQGRHLNQLPQRWVQMAGLMLAAATNVMSRRTLAWHFERKLFSTALLSAASPFEDLTDLPTQSVALNPTNMDQVLLATGTIPLILEPVLEIKGLGKGAFYDGGITDYHFDFPLSQPKGLTIYPHFYPDITPGWFDKSLSWRRGKLNHSRTLILAPSNDFIAQLPYGKIPDRADFSKMDSDQRITYWNKAVALSARLAEDFDQILNSSQLAHKIEKL